MESGGSTGAAASRAVLVEPSLGNALPYFAPLLIFPLVVLAALNGGWWFAGPFVFLAVADKFDQMFGMQERNMDPDRTPESRLFVYKLSAWSWAVLWPVVFAFGLWQMLAAGHLAAWEIAVMAVVLVLVGQTVFVVGHELVHRRSSWERHLGEFLLASASYPHYATEHVYIHHPMVCTPADPGSAPRGMSFWRYLPREIASNLTGAWKFEQKRLARSRLPAWHYSNPFWRYVLFAGAWYALVYALGGVWPVLIYAVACSSVVFSMKVSNYVQHYGLRRVRMPSGRFERVLPRHAWSADYKFTNWLYYNMQRHADHHAASNRRYPLLQHYGKEESPQLPDRYSQMNSLALFPSRWFKLMDPLLDRQRAYFYPDIEDWRAYDSPAFAARPEAFDAIAEIIAGAPRLAAWMNRTPELLDSLRTREFTDLDLPDGFGVDAEFERIARRGLVRLYWTHELGTDEMKEQLAATHTQNAGEAVGVAREWSNGKLFQLGVHTMRGNLTPAETGVVASRVAEASISAVLSAVCEDFAERRSPDPGSSVCAVVFGDLASGDRFLGAELDILFLYEGGPPEYFRRALPRGSERATGAFPRQPVVGADAPRGPAAPRPRVLGLSGLPPRRGPRGGTPADDPRALRLRVWPFGPRGAVRSAAARSPGREPRAPDDDVPPGRGGLRRGRARAHVPRRNAGRLSGRRARGPLPPTEARRAGDGPVRPRRGLGPRGRRRSRAGSGRVRPAAGRHREGVAEPPRHPATGSGGRLYGRRRAGRSQGRHRGRREGGRLRRADRPDPRSRGARRRRCRSDRGYDGRRYRSAAVRTPTRPPPKLVTDLVLSVRSVPRA